MQAIMLYEGLDEENGSHCRLIIEIRLNLLRSW